ncbi:MAG TPA: hypothetical protein VJB99_04765 [Patescibacteria group bacterium]|nr:hypothetical protein [Patescibacteria group bacterium]
MNLAKRGLVGLCVFVATGGFVPPAVAGTVGTGDLIKCPDFSSVYYLADDGNRYAFPNEKIFQSWYEDFSSVKTIACSDLASLRLAGIVRYREGVRLVKIQSNPMVYAVESDGKLRPLKDERQAILLYGENWKTVVDDLPETFFSKYVVGEMLAEGEIPEGLLSFDFEEKVFRMGADGEALEIDALFVSGQGKTLKKAAQSLVALQDRLGKIVALERVVGTPNDVVQAELDALTEVIFFDGNMESVHVSFEELETETPPTEIISSPAVSGMETTDLLSDLNGLADEAQEASTDLENLSEHNEPLE